MKKKIQKPFSVEAWRNGAKVETRSGRSVRILCTDIKSAYSIVAATTCEDGEEAVTEYDANGHFCIGSEDNCDLVIVEEVEEPERWGGDPLDKRSMGEGWRIMGGGIIQRYTLNLNVVTNYDVFATQKQAKSALAMARISQLMAHDERYGGVVTEEEWDDTSEKFVLYRCADKIAHAVTTLQWHHFLAFHTIEQRELFLAENEQLIKDYLMID